MKLLRKSAGAAALLLMLNTVPVLADTGLPATPVTADHYLPVEITVEGKPLSFDQPAVRQGERLYVPLRFIAEAAGGYVEWEAATQRVLVAMPDRFLIFTIGQDEADMKKHGMAYIRPNLVKMAAPVQIIGGRTMIPADALTTIFDLYERPDKDLTLDLIANPATAQETPPTGKLIPGDAQVTAIPVADADVPSDLQEWAASVAMDESPSYKAVVGADDNIIVGLSGGLQPTGGYTFELLGGGARLVDETWYLDVKLVPPTGMATTALTNPIAFFKLQGVIENVEVKFWEEGVTP